MSGTARSKARRARLHCVMAGHVERGEMPGVVTLVSRRGDVDGGYGTSWASDPREDLVAIMMTQRAGFPGPAGAYVDFWTSVYRAIDD